MTEAAPDDRRPPLAQAAAWASRVMTVALEMVLPGVAGIWIDRKLGWIAICTVVGFGLGFSVALWHLLRLTRQSPNPQRNKMSQEESPVRRQIK